MAIRERDDLAIGESSFDVSFAQVGKTTDQKH